MNSAELTLFPSHCGSDGFYCRVILPDLSTTVVKTQKGETVGEMLLKLLERRSLTYNAVEAYLVGSHQVSCFCMPSHICFELSKSNIISYNNVHQNKCSLLFPDVKGFLLSCIHVEII